MGLAKTDKKTGFNIRTLGFVFLIMEIIGVVFSLYILIFGVKTTAEFTKLMPAKSKYINHYVYTADNEEYEYTERVSRKNAGKAGDTVTVRYIRQLPSVTYNYNVLGLGAVMAAIGGLALYFGKTPNE